jgi:hypothetical protein
MKRYLAIGASVLIFGWNGLADSATPASLDIRQIHNAATNAHSLFLDDARRMGAVDTFLKLVRIKGPSGQEQSVREEVKRILTLAGTGTVPAKGQDPEAPCNLVMEIPGSGGLADQPCILLNAHLDTIERSTPELLAFDAGTGDFFFIRWGRPVWCSRARGGHPPLARGLLESGCCAPADPAGVYR